MEDKSENRICQNCKKDFTIELEDFNFYEKIKVPPPTFCPECRLIRRLCWRNERSLYKRNCDFCNIRIISMHSRESSFPVYCPECWRSDKWNPSEYGLVYDFSKPFFEQWRELFYKIPHYSIRHIGECINSEYANYVDGSKNVYLSYSAVLGVENVYYSNNITENAKIIIDSSNVSNSELIYENIGVTKNYNCQYSYWSSGCIDCNFILDCMNCSDCFGCVNLRNKKYCIRNEQYSREEYFKKIKYFNMGSYKFIQDNIKIFWDFSLRFPRKFTRIVNCINSSGDEIRDCKNSLFIFNSYGTENSKYVYRAVNSKNSMDVCYINSEMVYEFGGGGATNSQNLKFIIEGRPALSEVEYSDSCQSSNNLFGCIGLKNAKYCILNKQYEKDEYFKMVEKIKHHMDEMPFVDKKGRVFKYGEFFPYEFSPFGYNETIAFDFSPISRNEATEYEYNWREKEENQYVITKKIKDLPDDIKDVEDSILNEVLECSVTKKAFKITSFELQTYRQMRIPIPRIHQDERYRKRFKLINPIKLWHRTCMKEGCTNEFETSYAPDRPEIVYCERCYQQEVY